MGLALKQWSMYLGNVLLNFIQKERKTSCENQLSNSIEHFHHQQLSNLAISVANGSSNFLPTESSDTNQSETKNQRAEQKAVEITADGGKETETECSKVKGPNSNAIEDTTTVVSQAYCPCCHYHSHLQQQQLASNTISVQQQQQQKALMVALHQQGTSSQNFQQSYYNYASDLSPIFVNQRQYVSIFFTLKILLITIYIT